jgi:hypothetical protein
MAANIYIIMQAPEIKIIQSAHFEILSVELRSDGLVHVKVKGNEEIEIKNVVEVVSSLEKFWQGKKFPLLIVVGEYTLPSADARAYIATPESDPYASAEAYVIQSLSQKLVGNVYLSLNKPARPTRLFNSEEKAIEWLKTFL